MLQMGLIAPFWTLLLLTHQDRDPPKPGMAGEGSQPVSQSLCSSAHALSSCESVVFCLCFAYVLPMFCLCFAGVIHMLNLHAHSDLIAHSSLLSVIVLFCLCVLQGLTHKARASDSLCLFGVLPVSCRACAHTQSFTLPVTRLSGVLSISCRSHTPSQSFTLTVT
jgi:hypothetical protein